MEVTLSYFRHPSLGRRPAAVVMAVVVAAAVGLSAYINSLLDLRPGPNEFDVPAWEARNFLNKWLYEFGDLFRAERPVERQNDDLQRFFAAVRDVERLERDSPEAASGALAERNRVENRAEDAIEARITEVAEDEGLQRGLWLLPDMVWPPVDMEFTTPPRTLAVSPRDRIELKETRLLRAGLDLDDILRIERQEQARGGVSALTFPVSGVGAYPTVVSYSANYREAVEVAAHEWTHNYLSFRPLGVRYYQSNDLRTMNETVADLVGREIAEAVLRRWPLPEVAASAGDDTRHVQPAVDLRAELVKLRGEVDGLLAANRIEEAEALMEDRRQYLAANGHYIRKINQAYFAFVNLYAGEAGSPGATNPIGPKIDELRRRSPSLAAFLKVAGDLKSVEDLDQALSELARSAESSKIGFGQAFYPSLLFVCVRHRQSSDELDGGKGFRWFHAE